MLLKPIKSPILTSHDTIFQVIEKIFQKNPLREKDILVITSKVIALTEGRTVKIPSPEAFDHLVQKEADTVIGKKKVTLTMKNGIFIAWAGVDRSNTEKGSAILWPHDCFQSAEKLRGKLLKRYGLKKLGILITDSCCTPLRKGVTGIALGYAGFYGVQDLRGKQDIFGNTLQVTQQAVADMLAAAANLLMGEGSEAIPFVLIQKAPVQFTSDKIHRSETGIDPKECLFSPFYKGFM